MYEHDNASELNLNKSFRFDVIRYKEIDNYTDRQIRHIVDTVWKSLSFSNFRNKSLRKKYREMLKNYVLNLIKSYQIGYCIRVSRNKNDYYYLRRYHRIFTTASIVIKTMDALRDNDWVDQYPGFFDQQNNRGKQTRLFPSKKFINLVEKDLGTNNNKTYLRIRFAKEGVKETIQLRHKINDHKYKLIDYKDTPKTIRMRNRLKIYNHFMYSLKAITVITFTRKELTNMNPSLIEILNNLMLNDTIFFLDRKMKKGSKVNREVKKEDFIDIKSDTYKVECDDLKSKYEEQCKLCNENQLPYTGYYSNIDKSTDQEHYFSFNTNSNDTTKNPVSPSELGSPGAGEPQRAGEPPLQRGEELESSEEPHREVNPGAGSPPQGAGELPPQSADELESSKEDENPRKEGGNEKNERPITKELANKKIQYQPDSITILMQDYDRENEYYSIDQVLKDYPRSRKFWFRIDWTCMYRVFSDTSNRFDHHGRFYGDPVQNFPSWIRTKITMGHKKVVECDYTSLHPTMLYVMAGAVPPDNIYMIDKETDSQLRKEYKTVLLVSINHKNPKTMWSAVSKHFREQLGYKSGDRRLTKKYIMNIYTRLLEHNKPIGKYMNTGVAMKLMRKDSEIADRIMHTFVSKGIPIRCVHDSFIVPTEHEQALKTLMVKYFQEVMKTDYVIGITTETASGKALHELVAQPAKKEIVAKEHQSEKKESDEPVDNMKYFEEIFDDKDDNEDFTIIPDGSKFSEIRI